MDSRAFVFSLTYSPLPSENVSLVLAILTDVFVKNMVLIHFSRQIDIFRLGR